VKRSLLLVFVFAAGCVQFGGGNDYVSAVYYPSLAEEGAALDRAKDKGIITDQEAEAAKKMLEKQRESEGKFRGERAFPR
jgi:hypothetical protein